MIVVVVLIIVTVWLMVVIVVSIVVVVMVLAIVIVILIVVLVVVVARRRMVLLVLLLMGVPGLRPVHRRGSMAVATVDGILGIRIRRSIIIIIITMIIVGIPVICSSTGSAIPTNLRRVVGRRAAAAVPPLVP